MKYYLRCTANTYISQKSTYSNLDWAGESNKIKKRLHIIRMFRKIITSKINERESDYAHYTYSIRKA